jgi:hypothetical protein
MAVAYDFHTQATNYPYASVASYSWSHNPTGTPRGVFVFVYTNSATKTVTGVTYDGTSLTEVTSAAAVDTSTEPARIDVFFLGSSVPTTDPATVVVSRTNNTVGMGGVAVTVTAGADTEIYESGIVLLQENGTFSEQSVTDGGAATDSLRFASGYAGTNSPPGAGSSSTVLDGQDWGSYGWRMVRETTAGTGSRSVGFSTTVSDDRAGTHFAIREVAGTPYTTTLDATTTVTAGLVKNPKKIGDATSTVTAAAIRAAKKVLDYGGIGYADDSGYDVNYSFDGYSDATTIQTSDTLAGTSPFAVTIGSGNTVEYDTVRSLHGTSASGHFKAVTNSNANVVWSGLDDGGSGNIRWRFYIYLGQVDAQTRLIRFINSAGALIGTWRFLSDRTIALLDGNATLVSGTTFAALSLNTWYRFEGYYTQGTTAANGASKLSIYEGESSTPVEEKETTGVDFDGDATTFDRFSVGTVGTDSEFWIESLAVDNASTTYIGAKEQSGTPWITAVTSKAVSALRSVGATLTAAFDYVKTPASGTPYTVTLDATTALTAGIVKAATATRAATSTITAAITKVIVKAALAATTTLTAVGQKAVAATRAATSTVTAAITKAIATTKDVATTLTVAGVKNTVKALAATTTLTAANTYQLGKAIVLDATTTLTAGLSKAVTATRAATSTVTAAISKVVSMSREATTTVTAAVTKAVATTKDATSTVTAAQTKSVGKPLGVNVHTALQQSPDDIANLVAWWKADDLVLSDGDPVSTWTDAANAIDLTNSGSNRPTYVASSIIGGMPSVYFNNANSTFLSTTNSTIVNVSNGEDLPRTIFVVAREELGGSFGAWGSSLNNQSRWEIGADNSTTWVVATYDASNNGVSLYGGPARLGEGFPRTRLFTVVYPGTTMTMRRDRTIDQDTQAFNNGNFTPNRFGIGAIMRQAMTNYMTGYISEVIVYDRALTTAEVTDVESYLYDKYNLGLQVMTKKTVTVKHQVNVDVSPTQPDSISGLAAWFKADSLALSDGDAVTTWNDSSSNAYNVTQASAGAKPTYKATGLNGQPTVRFDGSDVLVSTATPTFSGPMTAFFVANLAQNPATQTILVGPVSTFNGFGVFYNGQVHQYWGSNLNGTTTPPGTPYLGSFLANGASSSVAANRGTTSTGNPGAFSWSSKAISLGGNNGRYLNADISEVILYDRDLTDAEQAEVETYLYQKYGLGLGTGIKKTTGKLSEATSTLTAVAQKAATIARDISSTVTAAAQKSVSIFREVGATLTAAFDYVKNAGGTAYTVTLDAATTLTAGIVKAVGATRDATSTLTAAMTKAVTTTKNVAVTVAANLVKSVTKPLAQSITMDAGAKKDISIFKAATSTLTAFFDYVKNGGTQAFTITLNAATTVSAAVTKAVGATRDTTNSVSAAVTKAAAKTFDASTTVVASALRAVQKFAAASVSVAADIVTAVGARALEIVLEATTTLVAGTQKNVTKLAAATTELVLTFYNTAKGAVIIVIRHLVPNNQYRSETLGRIGVKVRGAFTSITGFVFRSKVDKKP